MTKQALASRPRRIDASCMTDGEREALAFVLPLSPDYPGIERWFADTVVPGLRAETRRLVRIERHGRIAALGIAKDEGGEAKIC
ncbi:MAG: N-acetyltransferase, partial [Alphaproteobacteria bacterium]|nr:N-acetyltransferase [Alphaproteobacteria bacterium]